MPAEADQRVNLEFLLLLGTAATLGWCTRCWDPTITCRSSPWPGRGSWSERKAMTITLLSGLGHVTSSVVIGAVGLLSEPRC